jgi:hypothetical protein
MTAFTSDSSAAYACILSDISASVVLNTASGRVNG